MDTTVEVVNKGVEGTREVDAIDGSKSRKSMLVIKKNNSGEFDFVG